MFFDQDKFIEEVQGVRLNRKGDLLTKSDLQRVGLLERGLFYRYEIELLELIIEL